MCASLCDGVSLGHKHESRGLTLGILEQCSVSLLEEAEVSESEPMEDEDAESEDAESEQRATCEAAA